MIGAASVFLPRQASAQAPQAFKYQTVVRDNSGEIIPNQLVSFRIGILQDDINGTLVYSKTHGSTTNQFGMAVLEIGTGSIVTGVFGDISWGTASHFLKLELDQTGGTNYQFMGVSQLLSVPYCQNATSLTLTSPDGNNYEITVSNSGYISSNCFPMPSVADAGPNQLNVVSPITLAANAPDSGTGLWEIISGTGGIIADPTDPSSSFSGLSNNSYTLRWRISTSCSFSSDNVIVLFAPSVPCPATITDIDGNTYNAVQIGTQCWMAENLNVGTMINSSGDQTDNSIIEKYCFDDDLNNCGLYGGLYQWDEMMQYVTTEGAQGICPVGWHLPSDAEWSQLTDHLINIYPDIHGNNVGDSLKSCRQVNSPLGGACNTTDHPRWDENATHYGANSFSFGSLPGGYFNGGSYTNLGAHGYWRSATQDSSTKAWRRGMSYGNGSVSRNYYNKTNGVSARCLRD